MKGKIEDTFAFAYNYRLNNHLSVLKVQIGKTIFSGTDKLFEVSLFVKVILNFIGLGYFFYKIKNLDQLKYFFKEGKFI